MEKEIERLVEQYRRRAALPGFRRGKAPTDLVRVQYQGNLESDLLNHLIPEAYEKALQEQGLRAGRAAPIPRDPVRRSGRSASSPTSTCSLRSR